ncbi:MAG: PAS domain S-box protein [Desulfobulbaceae bacterium]|uniref:histidine kinase n=1 Tax=Candidatus Desulfobia pelagia TaxID=2841692 RepID=A0A8J6TD07_9BACT|nr:PAS domain S-box protein [Candidatus Desulfobia pelagia]
MFFQSIRVKLYLILTLLAVILALMSGIFLAHKKVSGLDQTYSRVVELDKKLSYHISQEMRSLEKPGGLGYLTEQHEQLDRSCLECHGKKTDLIEKRVGFLSKLSHNKDTTFQIKADVSHLLSELTTSVSYIHEHHITTLKNLLNHNKVRQVSDPDDKPFSKSATDSAPLLDIIKQTVALQQHLAVLPVSFYSLGTTSDPIQFQADFRQNVDSFFKAINAFEDYSLDAQDGLLVEELLESGRTFEQLFVTLIDLEIESRALWEDLQGNHKEVATALSWVEKQIQEKRDSLKKQIVLMERGSFFFVVLLVILIFLRSREIIRSVNGIVMETERIQNDISYRIQEDPTAATEFQVVSRALNSMTQNIDSQTRKLHEEIVVRIQAEHDLTNERERLTVTLRSIGDGVITTDIEGKIVFINKVAEQLTGWSNEEAQGKPSHEVFNIINERTGQKCASPVSRVLEFGRIVGLANHTALITKNGAQISIADSGAPIRDAESKITGVVIVFRDVTNERRIEEEQLKVRKLESVGVLAGGIAHDFNNILAAILGNIKLASLRVKDDKVTSLLSSAQKATLRAAKLTQQLLTFSKGGDPIKEKTSINGIIQESADFVLHGSNVGCEYNSPDDMWMVNADSGQIGQVIKNLIINAKQAMPEGGKIQINCSNIEDAAAESLLSIHDGKFVCIRIQDTGIGIPKEIIDKIFDPYYTTKQQGSGLGLAVCHSIINKHDGHISVQSSPGKGTTFTIYLPAVSSTETIAPKVRQTGSAVRAARIMVMDDDKMIREVTQGLLDILGHEAVLVADGEQAINEYQKLQDSGMPVDLVIMDLTIPGGMGGQEAAKKLLQVDPRAKIIVASGYSNDPVMAGYREYGFCAAVAKPFDLAELRKGIESALS